MAATLLPVLGRPGRLEAMAKAAARSGTGTPTSRWPGSCWRWRAGERRGDPAPAGAGAQTRTGRQPVAGAELGSVHFVGIGGAGMSGIARILLARGVPVSGSDARGSATAEALRALGATVHIGHDAANIGSGVDTVVVSTAIRDANPEVVEAHRRGLRVLRRAAALAAVMAGRRGVAIAGTPARRSTTSMLVGRAAGVPAPTRRTRSAAT